MYITWHQFGDLEAENHFTLLCHKYNGSRKLYLKILLHIS